MVLIIKSQGDWNVDMRIIASQMINMESNQCAYDSNGVPTAAHANRRKCEPFNKYTHKSVEFDIQLTCGVVVMYTRADENYMLSLSTALSELEMPRTFHESIDKSTDQHMLVKSKIGDNLSTHIGNFGSKLLSYRTIITDPHYFPRAATFGSSFVWLILVKNESTFRGPYLRIEDADPLPMSEVYLNKSVCTIVYDCTNIFCVPRLLKQLDYPNLSQYTMFKAGQILRDPLYISWSMGIHCEIYYQFTKIVPQVPYPLHADELHAIMAKPVCGDDLKLKRLNLDQSCGAQLTEPFDYEKQEFDEATLVDEGKPKFPNDVCYITRIPLWGEFYVGTIENDTGIFDIALSPVAVNISHIHDAAVPDRLLHHIARITNSTAKLVRLRKCMHRRSLMEVMDMLDIHPVKKNIMRCMEMYGAYSNVNDFGNTAVSTMRRNKKSRQYYVVDKITDQIYLGVDGINDSHVASYQNTATILFRVISVDRYWAEP